MPKETYRLLAYLRYASMSRSLLPDGLVSFDIYAYLFIRQKRPIETSIPEVCVSVKRDL